MLIEFLERANPLFQPIITPIDLDALRRAPLDGFANFRRTTHVSLEYSAQVLPQTIRSGPGDSLREKIRYVPESHTSESFRYLAPNLIVHGAAQELREHFVRNSANRIAIRMNTVDAERIAWWFSKHRRPEISQTVRMYCSTVTGSFRLFHAWHILDLIQFRS